MLTPSTVGGVNFAKDRQCVSGPREAALGRGAGGSTGAQDRPAGAGDRFFAGVLAAHRRAAEAAGIEWKTRCGRYIGRIPRGSLTDPHLERPVKLLSSVSGGFRQTNL